jgi:hypothetical protein
VNVTVHGIALQDAKSGHQCFPLAGALPQRLPTLLAFGGGATRPTTIAGQSTQGDYSAGESYDLQELAFFLVILSASPALTFLSLFLHHQSP